MDHALYEPFRKLLEEEDKDGALIYVSTLINEGKIGLIDAYESLILPALYDFSCVLSDREVCRWKEHYRLSTLRLIIGALYPHVIKRRGERKPRAKKAIVFTPEGEHADIPAMILQDELQLAGFTSIYLGESLPREDALSALRVLKPDLVVISVTNAYNLVGAQRTIDAMLAASPQLMIAVNGPAFDEKTTISHLKFHKRLSDFADVLALGGDAK